MLATGSGAVGLEAVGSRAQLFDVVRVTAPQHEINRTLVERALRGPRVTRDRLDAIAGRARLVGVRAPAVIVIGDVAAAGLLLADLDGNVSPNVTMDP